MFRRRHKRPQRGEFPPSFEKAFFRQAMPTTPPHEAKAVLHHVREKGWSEERIAELILPYMPPPGSPVARGGVSTPPFVSTEWLDRHLPHMDSGEIRQLVDELERRGWTPARTAVAVLPYLLPKLPPDDAAAVLVGLTDIGVPRDEIARLSRHLPQGG